MAAPPVEPTDSRDAQVRWEHYAHGADIGVRGVGPSKSVAFEQAALALTAIVTEPGTIAEREHVAVACKAPDDELLLAEWLNAIICEMAARRMLFARYRVTIEGERLEGEAWGETVDVARHRPVVEPKGATYTTLRVAHDAQGTWIAQTVVDV